MVLNSVFKDYTEFAWLIESSWKLRHLTHPFRSDSTYPIILLLPNLKLRKVPNPSKVEARHLRFEMVREGLVLCPLIVFQKKKSTKKAGNQEKSQKQKWGKKSSFSLKSCGTPQMMLDCVLHRKRAVILSYLYRRVAQTFLF